MARYYISTLQINVWKEHTCVGCGTPYRYLLKRKKSARGGTPEAANANARKAAAHALAHEIDQEPCPTCGLYQPDMIGARRAKTHTLLCVGAGVVLAAVLIVASLVGYDGRRFAPLVAAGVCVVAGLAHLLADRRNPNSNMEANQCLAEERVESGRLVASRASAPVEGEVPDGGWSIANLMAYALFPVAVAAFVAPEALRTVNGYPVNSECWPPVAGRGDEVIVRFPDSIHSIKGMWNGAAMTRVVNAGQIGLPDNYAIPTTCASDVWGTSISTESSESNSSAQLWTDLHLPATAELDGKTLQLQIDLLVNYPSESGSFFTNVNGKFSHTTALRTVPAEAPGKQYNVAWWIGVVGGVALTLAAGVWLAVLASRYRRKALPTQLYTPNV